MIERQGLRLTIEDGTVKFEAVTEEMKEFFRNNKDLLNEELGKVVQKELNDVLVNNTRLTINRKGISALYIYGEYAINHYKENKDSWRLAIIDLLNEKKLPFVYVMLKNKKRPSSSDQTTN